MPVQNDLPLLTPPTEISFVYGTWGATKRKDCQSALGQRFLPDVDPFHRAYIGHAGGEAFARPRGCRSGIAQSCTTPITNALPSITDMEQRRSRIANSEEIRKMKKWQVVIPVLVIALFVAWYAFRPERLVVNQRVHEELPTKQGGAPDQTLASGSFHSILHPTSGTATIYKAGDGSRVLRLTDFKTSNGPDVHVYMVAADDANDSTTVEHAGFIDLGSIKGNEGDQNYAVGPDVDLSKYRAVSIWCKRFSVNFGTAPLVANQTISQK